MNNAELAVMLARGIFAVGDEATHDKTQRIEFKGGRYPAKETSLGGLNETALASVLLELLAGPTMTGDRAAAGLAQETGEK
jgi:hypothetical protein